VPISHDVPGGSAARRRVPIRRPSSRASSIAANSPTATREMDSAKLIAASSTRRPENWSTTRGSAGTATLRLQPALKGDPQLGRRIGTRRLAALPPGTSWEIGTLDGAVFALLGLLIAFTFSGAVTRFEARRHLVVEETNAIGTAYLRLDLLPVAAQPALRDAFRRYLDARLEVYRSLPDLVAAKQALARSVQIQGEIWRGAVAACRADPTSSTTILVLLRIA